MVVASVFSVLVLEDRANATSMQCAALIMLRVWQDGLHEAAGGWELTAMKEILTWDVFVLSFFAAGFWFWSTKTTVPPDPNDRNFKMISEDGKVDILRTAESQTYWNRWGACAAGAAAACQGLLSYLFPN